MNVHSELPKRKRLRLKNFDYSTPGAYFITICTENRRKLLSQIVGADVLGGPQNVTLLPHGKIADKYINQLNEFYDDISIESYVIMPNHIHIMLVVFDDGSSGTSTPTRQHSRLSQFVSTLKRFCNKECGKNIWQRHFNDHIIRNREDYEEHLKYICENPMRWYYDELYSEE